MSPSGTITAPLARPWRCYAHSLPGFGTVQAVEYVWGQARRYRVVWDRDQARDPAWIDCDQVARCGDAAPGLRAVQ